MIRLFQPGSVYRLAYSSQVAHQLFEEIPQRTLCSILSSPIAFSKCIASHLSSPLAISQLHALSVTSGLFSCVPVSNSLINAYSKFGYSSTSLELFQIAPNRDTVSWNTIISSFGCVVRGMMFVLQMLRGGYSLDASTISTILSFSSNSSEFLPGFQIHSLASKSGHVSDTVVGNALITFYSRSGLIEDAQKVFDEMLVRDTVTWNALIHGFAHESDNGHKVIPLFLRMLKEDHVRPNNTTVATVVPFCDSGQLGTQIHCLSFKIGSDGDLWVSNALMSMYYRSGVLDYVRNVFGGMELRDVVSWTSMMSIDPNKAVSLFNGMRLCKVTPNDVTFVALIFAIPNKYSLREAGMLHTMCYKFGLSTKINVLNSLITMYARLGLPVHAKKVFDEMPVRDIISWNALISGYQQNGLCEETLQMFSSLVLHLKPNEYTFGSVLCSISTGETISLVFGRMCHCYINKLGLNTNEFVSGALIDMYAKQGSLEDSVKVFNEISVRTIVSWTAIISAHSKHGNYDRVLDLFENMVNSKIAPDGITLLAVLMACGSKGDVIAGKRIFDSIYNVYKVEPWPEHYSCMVDMLGKVGRLEEAESLVKIMPGGPSMSALQSLLNASKVHGDTELGDRVADLVLKTDPSDSGAYVSVSNVYAERGEWENVARVRKEMKEKGVKKEIGFSWVDVRDVGTLGMYKFSSEDTGHPMAKDIYEIVESLVSEMKFLQEDVVDLEMETLSV
ncbi:Pentatricopeptide repeat-containing protein [Rhynchospora pubera]|uniref:Pentatricopeptide repeat-containing protein n=1 Tax=Rhynchospora pubera TaxID=906938 RepID=A0AAV8CP54_9POAL|nr:Pentatricopeptide repeat-containing protein [Rhynchospora pubera]